MRVNEEKAFKEFEFNFTAILFCPRSCWWDISPRWRTAERHGHRAGAKQPHRNVGR